MVALNSLISGFIAEGDFTQVICLSNNSIKAKKLAEIIPNKLPITVLTSHLRVAEHCHEAGIKSTLLEDNLVAHDLGVLSSVHDFVIQAMGEGGLSKDDRLLVVLLEPVEGIIIIEPGQLVLNRLAAVANEHGVELEVLTKITELARRLGSRGRENRPVGALFAIGSIQRLRGNITAIVLNPFKGHSEAKRTVLNPDNLESLAEFAWLDGAILFNNKGIASDAGRYVQVGDNIHAKSGEGGRHLAARAISQQADAIAICVSSNGTISLYSKGKLRYSINLN